MTLTDRHAPADRRNRDLVAEVQRDMDREVARQRVQANQVIAAARKIPPTTTWAEVAAWVSDEVWERILNDAPVSRSEMEKIRPAQGAPTLPAPEAQPRAATDP